MLEIRYVLVGEAATWDGNPKQHDIGGLIQSIEKYGFRDAPIWDETLGAIVAGNGRAHALREMEAGGYAVPEGIKVDEEGRWWMPMQVGVDAKSAEEARAFGIDHNNLTMTGGDFSVLDIAGMWDPEKYAGMLEGLAELKALPLTVDPEALEVVKGYRDRLIPLSERIGEVEETEEEFPKVGELGPFQVPGIYQGDAREMLGQLPGESVHLVVTSPPYDDLRDYEGYDFNFREIVDELYRVMVEGGIVVWVVSDATHHGSETCTSFRQALGFREVGFNLHDTMIWYKKNAPPLTHRRYEQRFEYMFVFSKGAPRVFNPIMVPKQRVDTGRHMFRREADGSYNYGRYNPRPERIAGNVWSYATAGASPAVREMAQHVHPATFPLELAEDHIRSWSNPGDVVLDPMCGSGTTLVMAQRLGRQWIGFDIAERYVELSRRRLAEEMGDG